MSQEPFKVGSDCHARATQHKEAFRINRSISDITFCIFTVQLFKLLYLSISISSYL